VSGRSVSIMLTNEQLAVVAREMCQDTVLAQSLSPVSELQALRRVVASLLDDENYSRSTFRALLVLASFPADGSERELTDVARELGLSPSTTHRYLGTWLAVAVIEQSPSSRRYRRVQLDTSAEDGGAVPGRGDES
jgi:IclR helix-turn-helix domain